MKGHFDQRGVRVLAFGLDDTLAGSKSQIDLRITELLARALDRVDVRISSGRRFESQVLTQAATFEPRTPVGGQGSSLRRIGVLLSLRGQPPFRGLDAGRLELAGR